MNEIKQRRKLTKEELASVIKEHGLWLNKMFLSKQIDLDDVSVKANLMRADLSRADLKGVDLSRADLSEADLSGADLSGAFLHQSIFFETNLCDADLFNADLSGYSSQSSLVSRDHLSRYITVKTKWFGSSRT